MFSMPENPRQNRQKTLRCPLALINRKNMLDHVHCRLRVLANICLFYFNSINVTLASKLSLTRLLSHYDFASFTVNGRV